MIVMRIVSDALGRRTLYDGLYVLNFDPDARHGLGEMKCTHDLDKALTFANHAAAHAYWTQASKVQPLRPDGKPNRPLTAFNVALIQV